MTSVEFVKKIKNYAIAAFLVPLIAINSCFFIYKFLGDVNIYPDINWDKEEIKLTLNEYYKKSARRNESNTFTNCPAYNLTNYFVTADNQIILDNKENNSLILKLEEDHKIKYIILKRGKILNDQCVINHRFSYLLFKKFSLLEKILVDGKKNNPTGFVKIKNPYIHGEVSISRTARYSPAIWIFKTLIILSSFLLFLYWKNTLNLFTELKNKNILVKFSKKFFYLGVISCILLALHAIFLGLDFDSKLYSKTRRLIVASFIFFEIFAQIFLTRNLLKYKEELKRYINPIILIIKIIFVTTVFFTTCAAFAILAFGDPSTAFKHTLEWNYFAFLLLYYLFSRLLWKSV